MRILVVEDEKRLAGTLSDLLKKNGYSVDIAYDGITGLDNAQSGIYDLVLLDVMLPRMDGYHVLQNIRAQHNPVKVLMLTARAELTDRIHGLDAGADYYLTKPYEPAELLACVRSLLRRNTGDNLTDARLHFEDLILDPATYLLQCHEKEVRLSRREFDILELLIRNGQQVVTKEQLLLKVWGYDSDAEDNNVEVYISFLRRKLTHLRSTVKIKTLRMVGYCLEVEES